LSAGEHAVPFDALRFRYPNGGHDAASLLVHPDTGLITIVTRDRSGSGTTAVYEFPASQPSVTSESTLLARGSLSAPAGVERFTVTDGDVHPQGQSVLLRTDTDLFFYPMQLDRPVADALLRAPCALAVAEETAAAAEQTPEKAISWLRSGNGYVTVGKEQSTDVKVDVDVVVCGAN
jgi:hypothetical protein